MSGDISALDKLIRKLRKKLRQIERLEILGRSLNEEEIAKVKQKDKIRSELYKQLELVVNTPHIENGKSEGESTAAENEIECDSQTAEMIAKPSVSVDQKINAESEIELMETSENSSPANSQELNMNTAPNLEFTATEITMDSGEPMETLENGNSNHQLENESQPLAESDRVSVRVPTKRASPTCESPVSATTTNRKRKKCEPSENIPKLWSDDSIFVTNLEAHNDLVCCVDIDSDYILSGSRDTLVQVWDAKTGSPFQNLRGHSNSITCVSLLSTTESHDLVALLSENAENSYGNDISPRLALSASMDCCFKLWNIIDGSMLTSTYTYSSITAMCYFPYSHSCIIGSEGGKLEVYSFFSDEQPNPLISLRAFDGPVSMIKLQNENIICSSLDGSISVFKLKNENGLELCRLFHSESLTTELGQAVTTRPVLSLGLSGSTADACTICYGDEGANLKVLNWKQGQVKKFRNHIHEFGLTNAITTTESYLLSSSLNVDTGCSTINVRSLPDLNYEGTLDINGIERIVCVAATETQKGLLKLVVGGSKLTLLETNADPSPRKCKCIKPLRRKELALAAEDSGDESICSSSDDENEMPDDEEEIEESESKSTSWCNLL